MSLLAEMTIEAVLANWPKSVEIFRNYRMIDCFGCQVASFCTIAEAIEFHELDSEKFLSELKEIINIETN